MLTLHAQKANFLSLTEKDLDRPIYRIMPEIFVLDMFSLNKNTLTQTHKWKDKFENFLLNAGGIFGTAAFDYGFKDAFVGQCWTSHSRSEAMWGIYANDPNQRFLRIRSTPRRLLCGLVAARPEASQDRCFIGKVRYVRERTLRDFLYNDGELQISPARFAHSLLLKRPAFKHEGEFRLLYFGNAGDYQDGLFRYAINPHELITQIMADPNRDREHWVRDKAGIQNATRFAGEIKRSKIYDPPDWKPPVYHASY
ncbi:hypothetical protein KKP04_00050 [Rhodomicrobium sp. Az07]|uniref:hypothetical protein n=1 Tax=Rhodomicrobium sp. Az07 TaxID=2839034 RepID=UPI001BEBF091|nr:hypothetical protein [Rhodomicrobium sp. Az07]MBT3069264.1 hypothetical protein [Rhodomicrobium sp. Az07]